MMKATIPSDEDEEWTGRRPNLLQYKQPRKGEKQKKKNGGDDALLEKVLDECDPRIEEERQSFQRTFSRRVVLSVVRVAVAL